MQSISNGLKLICCYCLISSLMGCSFTGLKKGDIPKQNLVIEQFSTEEGLQFMLCRDCEKVSKKTVVTIRVVDRQREVTVPIKNQSTEFVRHTIHFAFDSDEISTTEKTELDKVLRSIDWLRVKSVKILGYTDNIGTAKYNQSLSLRRAQSVSIHLKVSVSTETGTHTIVGHGQCCYISPNHTNQGRANNRRAVLIITYL